MSYDVINGLIKQFSSELALADSKNLTCLSGLLPLLKQLHSKCMDLSLKSEAKEVIRARNYITQGKKDKSPDIQKQILFLEKFISGLSESIENSDIENQSFEIGVTMEKGSDTINDNYGEMEKKLDEFTALIGEFCPGEIPDLGIMINNLNELIEVSKQIESSPFHQICLSCKHYVENMTLENMHNTKPIEEGLVLLKSILSHMKRGEKFTFDYSDVLELLEIRIMKEHLADADAPAKEEAVIKIRVKPQKISDDDMEILIDFISEALENLENIEVNLIDLEQDPSNKDIINNIFRSFHTIKGVSGFLSLTKINKLAHATENFLDSARSGDFLINDSATDVILESVDTLKKLVDRVHNGIETGVIPPDDDIDVNGLYDKLQTLQQDLAKGEKELLGEILVRKKVVDRKSLELALETQKNQPEKKIGEILIEAKKLKANEIDAALMDQNLSKRKMDSQVKVSTQKLDDLVDYAGELVIAQSMLRQKTINDPSLTQHVAQLGQIVSNMQTIAMSMRMIPIKATFMKMIRLVRDLAKKSGKQVNLVMVGEDTEIDRNVVDALYEPMVHMIRNSCDHGIEAAPDRLQQKKPAQGEIVLRAYHKGGYIIIEIEDDGRGLDRDRILEKAKSTGLVDRGEKLTDAQVYDLILQPGFSTAQEITDVSGRGVGMDVVKSGIEKFRGQLNIESSKGKGTKFIISLPLTLAIIDGMLVRVDSEKYVIPTISIQKAFKPNSDEYFTVEGKGEMVKDRGNLIPVIRLDDIYGSSNQKKSIQDCLVVVVESKEEKRALLIDELLGKDEYVIKSLGNNLKDVEGIAGGAILADGRVGLILDIHGVFEAANG